MKKLAATISRKRKRTWRRRARLRKPAPKPKRKRITLKFQPMGLALYHAPVLAEALLGEAVSFDEVRGCLKKVRYEKKADAETALHEVHYKRGALDKSKKYCVYRCPWRCKGFHIGSKSKCKAKKTTSDADQQSFAATDISSNGSSTPIPLSSGLDFDRDSESGYSSGSSGFASQA